MLTEGDFLTRIKIEKSELDLKIQKLIDYINAEHIEELLPLEKEYLRVQLEAMNEYSRILGERLDFYTEYKPI